jgi:hypothetical protein
MRTEAPPSRRSSARRRVGRTFHTRTAASLAAAWMLAIHMNGGAALAQANPKFEHLKKSDSDKPLWKSSASAGFLLATGNANSYTLNGGGSVARVDPKNKIALDANVAYGQSTAASAADANGNMLIDADEITTETKPTTQLWNVKLRYDRFFSTNNAGFISTLIGGNEFAGKPVFGNVQVGYARHLYKSDRNEIFIEAGYDFSYEFYVYPHNLSEVPEDMRKSKQLQIHSLRLFFGHNLKLTEDTGLFTGLEGLFNIAPVAAPGYGPGVEQGPFKDTRINFKTALNTKLYKSFSFRFSFTALFDNVPAPRPPFNGVMFSPGEHGLVQKLDTLSEAALVVTFL